MGATSADTQREIERLRGDFDDALGELKRRVGGGLGGVATTDARISGVRSGQQVSERVATLVTSVKEDPGRMSVVGAVAVAVAGYALYSAVDRWRESRRPRSRLKRRIRSVREDLGERAEETRRLARRAREKGVMLRLGGEDSESVRLTDREGKSLKKDKPRRSEVLKNLLWAAMLALFMAFGSVIARRGAGAVWQATLREPPPTEK